MIKIKIDSHSKEVRIHYFDTIHGLLNLMVAYKIRSYIINRANKFLILYPQGKSSSEFVYVSISDAVVEIV